MGSSNVNLLIENYNADLLLQRGFRQGEANELLAIKTCLGWMLMGAYSNSSNRGKAKSSNHIIKVSNVSVSKEIERLWENESYGLFFKVGSKFAVSYWITSLTNTREQHNIKKWSLWNTFTMEKGVPKTTQ